MLPRAFSAMLVGGAGVRRPRRRFADRIRFELAEGAVHPSQGTFVVEDPNEQAPTARIAVTPVSPAAQALADELKDLSGEAPLAQSAGTPRNANK